MNPAKAMAMTVIDLLAGDAAKAREVLATQPSDHEQKPIPGSTGLQAHRRTLRGQIDGHLAQGGQRWRRLLSDTLADTTLPEAALAELERLNEAAAPLHIWLRTRANQPLQRPWHEAAAEPVPVPPSPAGERPRARGHCACSRMSGNGWRSNPICTVLPR